MSDSSIRRLTVTGEMSGDRVKILEQEFLPELHTNPQDIVFDLKNVSRIDSRGISLCIRLSKACQNSNTNFLIEAGCEIYRIFEQINLVSVINIKEVN